MYWHRQYFVAYSFRICISVTNGPMAMCRQGEGVGEGWLLALEGGAMALVDAIYRW